VSNGNARFVNNLYSNTQIVNLYVNFHHWNESELKKNVNPGNIFSSGFEDFMGAKVLYNLLVLPF
jgi:hypothetical protein